MGYELQIGEPNLLRSCVRNGAYHDCYFTLPVDYKLDPKTLYNQGSQFLSPIDFFESSGIKRKDYSYNFWIAKDGLWHAKETEAQINKDLRDEIRQLEHELMWEKLSGN